MIKKKWLANLSLGLIFIIGIGKAYSDDGPKKLEEPQTMLLGDWDQVTTVSKKAESISEAPAIVSVITEDQIQNWGAQTLREVFQFLPGITITDTYWGRGIITFREVMMTLYNDKALLLINGIPAYEAVNGEYYLELVPINAIKRIEVIRGPGSVLYGTNAFSGVINIITKTGLDMQTKSGEAFVKGGSFSNMEAGLSHGKEMKYGVNIFASAQYRKDNGDTKSVIDERGHMGDVSLENNNKSAYFQISDGNLTFVGNYMELDYNRYGMSPIHDLSGGIGEHKGYNFSMKYDHSYTDTHNLTSYIRYNNTRRENDVNQFPNYITPSLDANYPTPNYAIYEGNILQGEVQSIFDMTENFNLTSGMSFEKYSVSDVFTSVDKSDSNVHLPGYEGSLEYPPPKSTEWSIYSQAKLGAFNGFLNMVAGVRYTDSELSNSQNVIPRAGLVFRLTDKQFLKMLYGKAYRSPAYVEKYFKIVDVVYGNPDINEETIDSYEMAYDIYLNTYHKATMNLYYLQPQDIILRRNMTAEERTRLGATTGLIYDNYADQKLWGMEFEISSRNLETFSYFANFSIRDGEEKTSGASSWEEIQYLSKIIGNIGISYYLFETRWSISPNLQYVGEREGTLNNGQKNAVDAYTRLNLVSCFKITENMELKLEGINLLDEEYYYPERVRNNTSEVPGGQGISGYATLKYQY